MTSEEMEQRLLALETFVYDAIGVIYTRMPEDVKSEIIHSFNRWNDELAEYEHGSGKKNDES